MFSDLCYKLEFININKSSFNTLLKGNRRVNLLCQSCVVDVNSGLGEESINNSSSVWTGS